MKDINDIIRLTVEKTGQPEHIVEKALRGMFQDVQEFSSKKNGYCIQVPNVGTFVFRASAIPNYVFKQQNTLGYWTKRLVIGREKRLLKTIAAATNNIHDCFTKLIQVSLIKKEFLEKHAKYKPKTEIYLTEDLESDNGRVVDYVENVKVALFTTETDSSPQEDL